MEKKYFDVDDFINEELEQNKKSLEQFKDYIGKLYPDESPNPYPNSYYNWKDLYELWLDERI